MKFNFFRRKNRRTLDQTEFPTVIGEHTTYRGDLAGQENYVVHGRVEGKCDIQGRLLLTRTACWQGDIAATYVVVAGEVVGDVYASAKLELQDTARIRGNIASPVIALAKGAVYDGDIRRRPRPRFQRYHEKRS